MAALLFSAAAGDVAAAFSSEQLGGAPTLELVLPAAAALLLLAVLALTARLMLGSSTTAVAAAKGRTLIQSIGTHNPPEVAPAAYFLEVCDTLGYDAATRDYVGKIVRGGGVLQRHCIASCSGPASGYLPALEVVGARGLLWEDGAKVMAINAARAALRAWRRGDARDVTHVVVHSCTGFAAPGLDFHLIAALRLSPSTRKLGVNFMGCFGGFTALFVAKQIVEADPTGRAVVLVCCAEACSLHITKDPKKELIVGNTLFADGAAAAIVARAGFVGVRFTGAGELNSGADAAPADKAESRFTVGLDLTSSAPGAALAAYGGWALGDMASEIVPDSAGAMTWRQSPEAGRYDMFLDRAIPKALASLFKTSGLGMLRRVGIANPWACGWAVHPGGKGILTAFEQAFALLGIKGEGLSHSHAVLGEFGNMSSATIFFVLQRVLAAARKNDIFICGFGPGLTVEFGRVHRVAEDGVTEVAISAAEAAAARAQGALDAADAQAASDRAAAAASDAAAAKLAAAEAEQSVAEPAPSGGASPRRY